MSSLFEHDASVASATHDNTNNFFIFKKQFELLIN